MRYNFGWSSCAEYLNGWIPRLAFGVPIVGYLILFNDSIAQHIQFERLAEGGTSFLGVSGAGRLKLLYIGLVLLGLANILYRWQRPYLFNLATNRKDWVNEALANFSVSDYIQLHEAIRYRHGNHYTSHGKYYDAEWDQFLTGALGPSLETTPTSRDHTKAHWAEAKHRNESLLRSILIETYFRDDTITRRPWLFICVGIATIGYALLAIPSLDLFLKVMSVIVSPLIL